MSAVPWCLIILMSLFFLYVSILFVCWLIETKQENERKTDKILRRPAPQRR